MFNLKNTKFDVQYTSKFKKNFQKILKQGKDENKFLIENKKLVLLLFATGSHSDLF